MKDSTCFHRMLYAHVLFFFSHNGAILCRFSTTSYRCIRHIRKAGKGKKKKRNFRRNKMARVESLHQPITKQKTKWVPPLKLSRFILFPSPLKKQKNIQKKYVTLKTNDWTAVLNERFA